MATDQPPNYDDVSYPAVAINWPGLRFKLLKGQTQVVSRVSLPDPDSSCSYQHEMLATAIGVEDESDFGMMTLYHWHPPKVAEKATVMLSPAQLRNIDGFVSIGTFFLSQDVNISTALSDLLATQLAEASGPRRRATPELLTDLISRLPAPEAYKGDFVHFFAFPVISNNPDDILVTEDGLVPVWKWVKPEGAYRKAGSWEAELDQVLEDGEWNAGKDLLLLVREVDEVALRSAKDQGWVVMNFETFFSERLGY